MRLKNSVTIKEALDKMVKDLKLKPGIDETRIREAWVKIMGKVVAKYTTSVMLKKSKLYVKVEMAALKQELSFNRDKIKENVNKELGEEVVTDVIVY